MGKLFVSYSYHGCTKNDSTIYQGFGNTFLAPAGMPKNEEELELITNCVNQRAKIDLGMNEISCIILFFKKIGIQPTTGADHQR